MAGLKLKRIEAGRYRVEGTPLTIEKDEVERVRWGELTEWFVCHDDDHDGFLCITYSKARCARAVEKIRDAFIAQGEAK